MGNLVRVKLQNGAEASVGESFAKNHKLQILDKPATDNYGRGLPDKPKVALTSGTDVFDPSSTDVDGVNDYLSGADADEVTRVLQAEADGKNRKGIVEGPHVPSGDANPDANAGGGTPEEGIQ